MPHLSVSLLPNLGKTKQSPQSDLTPWILTLQWAQICKQFCRKIRIVQTQCSDTSVRGLQLQPRLQLAKQQIDHFGAWVKKKKVNKLLLLRIVPRHHSELIMLSNMIGLFKSQKQHKVDMTNKCLKCKKKSNFPSICYFEKQCLENFFL